MNVFTIPPDVPFLPALVRAVVETGLPGVSDAAATPAGLADWTVLVPTRRAARALMETFVGTLPGQARLLPRIRPIGDVDEDDILVSSPDDFDLPPAISGFQRQFLLARLIKDWTYRRPEAALTRELAGSPSRVLDLAASLAALVDSFDNDVVPLQAVSDLFGEALQVHRQEVLEFLEIIRTDYPGALLQMGLIGPVDRRTRLLQAEARRLAAAATPGPVVAAGSTGSIPATADLLAAIAGLPHGAVVLPGLDVNIDRESWSVLDPQHPQYGLKLLLERFGIKRTDVRHLPGLTRSQAALDRCWLASEIMRPVRTTHAWRHTVADAPERVAGALVGVNWIEAADQRHEAGTIALVARKVLESPGKTLAVVTPDRQLARMIKAELARWSIEVDDSAGEPLSRTPHGSLLMLILEAVRQPLAPHAVMALLDHPFVCLTRDRTSHLAAARNLELALLRGRTSAVRLENLKHEAVARRVSAANSRGPARTFSAEDWQAVEVLCGSVADCLRELQELWDTAPEVALDEIATAHLKVAEKLAASSGAGDQLLWAGEAGEALSGLFGPILQFGAESPPLALADYCALLSGYMAQSPVRPRHHRNAAIAIYGLLEARLIHADVTVLAGLNEDIWPGSTGSDPWLSRPQRAQINLQLPERRIGLSAHDFAQAFCSGEVWLTHSRKINGQPAVRSRWLTRLEALLKASDQVEQVKPCDPWTTWAATLDSHRIEVSPAPQPKPMPPLVARPRKLSVTQVDRLIRDPYSIFAGVILALKPLDPLAVEVGPRQRGELIHKALHRFSQDHAGGLGERPVEVLTAILLEELQSATGDASLAAFWMPQLERIALWFIEQERHFRADTHEQFLECDAAETLNAAGEGFTLTARADRVDLKSDGTLRLIDYKTGTVPSFKPDARSYSAQLDLEAWLAQAGAFKGISASTVSELIYIRLTGGEPAGELKTAPAKIPMADRVDMAIDGLQQLIAGYDRLDQPYFPAIQPDRERYRGDYDHLCRWQEWAHLPDHGQDKS